MGFLVDSYKIKATIIEEPEDTGDVEGDAIEALDYSEFTFVAVISNPVAGNVMRLQDSEDNVTFTDIPGAVALTGPVQYVCLVNHPCRYVRAVVARVEATAVPSVVSFRGNAGMNPQVNDENASAKGTVVVG